MATVYVLDYDNRASVPLTRSLGTTQTFNFLSKAQVALQVVGSSGSWVASGSIDGNTWAVLQDKNTSTTQQNVGGNPALFDLSRYNQVKMNLYSTGSGNFFVNINALSTLPPELTNTAGHLILSSSAGSIVTVSGAFKVQDSATRLLIAGSTMHVGSHMNMQGFRIYDANAHLVLSSSAGSQVTVSGTLAALSSFSSNGSVFLGGNCTMYNANTRFYHSTGHLILSSSAGSTITVSGNLNVLGSVSVAAPNAQVTALNYVATYTGGPFHVNALTSHLILSSSAGSIVAISGGLKATNIPSSDPGVPGQIYHDGSGALKVSL